MILYKGKIHPNEDHNKLLEQLDSDILMTLSQQGVLDPNTVIQACDALVKEIKKGTYDSLILPLLHEFDIPLEQLDYYINMFSKEALLEKVEIELGQDFDKDLRLDDRHIRQIHPLGVLFHIAAGNVDVLPAYSVIEGLLVGNINLLKLPTGDKGVSVTLLSELIKIEPLLQDYIYVFDVPSTDLESLKTLANSADAIVIWGGDEAVKATRQMATLNTKIIEWGHKLSFAYATLDASDQDLKDLAKHIIITNQLLCSSAQGIYLDTEDRNSLDAFAKRFFSILVEEQKQYSQVPYGIKAKNAVELYYQTMIQKKTDKTILQKDGISVITSQDQDLELSLLFRNVWVKMLPQEDIVTNLKPMKQYLQTVSILSNEKDCPVIEQAMIRSGITRIKKPNEMSEVTKGESHDGEYPLRRYSRVVELFKQ
jgi:hypothetical protein